MCLIPSFTSQPDGMCTLYSHKHGLIKIGDLTIENNFDILPPFETYNNIQEWKWKNIGAMYEKINSLY